MVRLQNRESFACAILEELAASRTYEKVHCYRTEKGRAYGSYDVKNPIKEWEVFGQL